MIHRKSHIDQDAMECGILHDDGELFPGVKIQIGFQEVI
jgi:hypothetical protein